MYIVILSRILNILIWGYIFGFWGTIWVHPWKFTRFYRWDEMRTFVSLFCLGLKLFFWNVFYWLYLWLCLDLFCWYLVNVSFLEIFWRSNISAICLSAMFLNGDAGAGFFNACTSSFNAILAWLESHIYGGEIPLCLISFTSWFFWDDLVESIMIFCPFDIPTIYSSNRSTSSWPWFFMY